MNRFQQVQSVSRCAVFVDVHNMFHSAKQIHNSKLNYANILKVLSVDRDIVSATAYLMCKPDSDSKGFEEAIKKVGFDIKRKISGDPQDENKRVKATNWELGMSLDMIKWASKVDVIVLVSGNGAFVETFNYLKNTAVRLEVVGFGQGTSALLKNIADDFLDISDKNMAEEDCLIPIVTGGYTGIPVDEEVATVK